MTTQTLKSQKHQTKADWLLDKGTEVLWKKGYNGTSVNDIVKAAGIPKGSFYFYFESKEDFVIKAIDRYFNTNMEPVLRILRDPLLTPGQRLLSTYQFRIDMVKEKLGNKRGCMACNIGNEMSDHSEKIRKAILQKEKMFREQMTDVVRQAQETGEINTGLKAADLVAFIEDASKGALVTMKEMRSSYPLDNLIRIIRSLILK